MGTFGATRVLEPGGSVIAHDDLQASASSATILLNPLTYSGSAAHVCLFHPALTSFSVRARGIFTSTTTIPAVCLYLLYYRDGNVTKLQSGDTSIPSDGTILHRRLYNAAALEGAVISLDCTFATVEGDSTYKYSPMKPSTGANIGYTASTPDYSSAVEIPRRTAMGVLVLTSQAGNVAGSSDTLEAQLLGY